MKDHEIRELVNTLTAIAVTYYGTQQLREHISKAVTAALKPRFTDGTDPDMSNAACLREINEALGGMDITMFSQVATGIRDMMEGYEEAAADKRRLVRELDVLLNGDGAAKQASLCDIVAQVRHGNARLVPIELIKQARTEISLHAQLNGGGALTQQILADLASIIGEPPAPKGGL
ncbi:TPA: hypothetical protein SMF87_004523 [Serratia marcescens]|nr:hypothetical protein [Serratia marcescens]